MALTGRHARAGQLVLWAQEVPALLSAGVWRGRLNAIPLPSSRWARSLASAPLGWQFLSWAPAPQPASNPSQGSCLHSTP